METQPSESDVPLGPAIILAEGDSAAKKGKNPRKRLPTATANSSTIQTRAQAKKSEQEGDQPPPLKKKRIHVKGTLGTGDNAIEVHPDSQHVVKGPSAPASASVPTKRSSPVAEVECRVLPSVIEREHESDAEGGCHQSPVVSPPDNVTGIVRPVSLTGQNPSTPTQIATADSKYNLQVTAEQLKFLQSLLGGPTPQLELAKDHAQGSLPTPESTPVKSKSVGDSAAPAKIPQVLTSPSVPESPSPAPRTPIPATKSDKLGVVDPGEDDSSSVPPGCQVTNPATQDPMLAPHYRWLTPLSHVNATSITGEIPSGFYAFSYWSTHIPDIDIDSVMTAVTFLNHGRNVNLARCNPALLRHKETKNGARIRRDIMFNEELALCFTTVFVRRSNIITRNAATGQKTLLGVPHSQEIDRMLAAIGMVLKVPDIRVNFYQSGISFNTYGRSATSTGTFSGFKSSIVSGTVRPKLATLNYTDPIFVFDARDWEFSLQDLLQQLDRQPEHLTIDKKMQSLGFELFNEELPKGSCAVVAHTITGSKEDGKYDTFAINFNIQFIILLGVPPAGQDVELTSSP